MGKLVHIFQSDLIARIQLSRLPDHLARTGILACMQVKERQELMCLQEGRMRRHDLFQLDNRQIFPVLLTVCKTLVVFLDRKVDRLQFLCRSLYRIDIVIRYIIVRTKIFTDDPFDQCLRHFADPVIDQAQKISGCNVFPVELQAAPQ